MSVADHAADAAALLDHLGIARAHVVGHSSGAAVAAQLALDEPDRVATLALLELSLFSVPSGEAFLAAASPVFEAYASGDPEAAAGHVPQCRQRSRVGDVPGPARRAHPRSGRPGDQGRRHDLRRGAAQRSPSGAFGADQAAAIRQPVLSVLGSNTAPLWIEVAEFLRNSVPDIEERTIDGVGHLLHIERPEPVAEAIADFLRRHPVT